MYGYQDGGKAFRWRRAPCKEFAFEGHIYHDYKRFGRGVERTDVIAGTSNQNVPADSYLWLMPMSTSELDVNPYLVQNPGY